MTPYYQDDMAAIYRGDNLDILPTLARDSHDSIVTDPPYGLGFMGRGWDRGVPGVAFWLEALRVAKPGAHLLAFGGPRTYHRLACAIEDAGWEVRDCIMWVFGSGFPKSHNLDGDWDGWGTALKPAYEPIIVARKPLVGTVAANVQAHGTGALNVDGCRVGAGEVVRISNYSDGTDCTAWSGSKSGKPYEERVSTSGRWPANLIHDGSAEVVRLFPDTGKSTGGQCAHVGMHKMRGDVKPTWAGDPGYGDTGSAARFYYCAKASKADRDEGLEEMAETLTRRYGEQGQGPEAQQTPRKAVAQRNTHPTVKPTDLMRYLCRLVTPPGGRILDHFMGSGSTGKAAMLECFKFTGIDNGEECPIDVAVGRIRHAMRQPHLPLVTA